jgi:hypothetical protein
VSAGLDSSRSRAAEAAGPEQEEPVDLGWDQVGCNQPGSAAQRIPKQRVRLGVVLVARAEERDRGTVIAEQQTGAGGAIPRAGLGKKRLGEVAVDLVAEVWRERLHHPAGCQQWIVLHRTGEGAEGYADRL